MDYEETFAHVARLGAIRLLLGVSCHLHFKLYQMDVESVFLNEFLNEDVFVEQPKGFWIPSFQTMFTNLEMLFMSSSKLIVLGMSVS